MGRAEEWRPVPTHDRLEASSTGQIRLRPYEGRMPHGGARTYGTGAPMKQQTSTGNRPIVTYQGKRLKVGRLVCAAFHGAPPPKAVCMHINDDPSDNSPENLRWGTQRENLNTPAFLAYCRSRTGANNPNVKGRARKAEQAQQ